MNIRNLISFVLFYTCLVVLISYVECIKFHLQPNTQKCLREELRQNVLITGDCEVSEAHGQKVDLTVRDSNGHILAQKEDVTKKRFSFVSERHDTFEICFISRITQASRATVHEVSLDVKTGVEAKSVGDAMGDAAKLKPMEMDLKRLEEISEAIVMDFADMKKREEELRSTNESTKNRVFYLSIFSIFILLALPTWQMLYLRKYFKSKKLIE